MGLKHCHCQRLPLSLRGAKRRSNPVSPKCYDRQTTSFIFFTLFPNFYYVIPVPSSVIPAKAGIQEKTNRG